MHRSRAVICLCALICVFATKSVSAAPILYTMSVIDSGPPSVALVGDPQGVAGLGFQSDGTVSYAKSIDVLTSALLAATASGSVLDTVELIGFDSAVSPALLVGTYRFTDVLFLSVSVVGLTESGLFRPRTVTFLGVPEPATVALCALGVAGLCAVRRKKRAPQGSHSPRTEQLV